MNRNFALANFFGVVLLAVLAVSQWGANRKANLEASTLLRTTQEQKGKLEEAEKSIRGQALDLDDFRKQLIQLHEDVKARKEALSKLSGTNEIMSFQIQQFKEEFPKWKSALDERDEKLRSVNRQLTEAVTGRNEVVGKYNDLARKYEDLVKEINASRPAGTNGASNLPVQTSGTGK